MTVAVQHSAENMLKTNILIICISCAAKQVRMRAETFCAYCMKYSARQREKATIIREKTFLGLTSGKEWYNINTYFFKNNSKKVRVLPGGYANENAAEKRLHCYDGCG